MNRPIDAIVNEVGLDLLVQLADGRKRPLESTDRGCDRAERGHRANRRRLLDDPEPARRFGLFARQRLQIGIGDPLDSVELAWVEARPGDHDDDRDDRRDRQKTEGVPLPMARRRDPLLPEPGRRPTGRDSVGSPSVAETAGPARGSLGVRLMSGTLPLGGSIA